MSVFSKGNFSINLGFIQVGGELTDDDRQCAWELYTEIVTRLSVYGKIGFIKSIEEGFSGEIYSESMESMFAFFRECRGIMKKFPVGKLENVNQYHLGIFIHEILNKILRPFLEKWQGNYRHWYEKERVNHTNLTPFDIQVLFPDRDKMLSEWSDLRFTMKAIAERLAKEYKLVSIEEEIL